MHDAPTGTLSLTLITPALMLCAAELKLDVCWHVQDTQLLSWARQ